MKVFVTIFALLTLLYVVRSDDSEVQEFKPEKECLAKGGYCVHSSKCPADKINTEAECTEQKSLGAVCCHTSRLLGETECKKLQGECMAECTENLRVAEANDCPEGQSCCVLV